MISLQNIGKGYGTKDLFANVNMRIDAGDRIGIIGSNGTGKTTLARIIVGLESPDDGAISRTKTWRLGYLTQEVERYIDLPLHDFVESGKPELTGARTRLEELESRIHHEHDEKIQLEYADALSHFQELGGYVVEAEVDRILSGLGFRPGDSKRFVKTFSGGWIMRAALSRLLFQQPELLILDEPTNHLDLPALQWLEEFLHEWKGAYLVISHDRTFLNNTVNKIAEMADGTLTMYPGNYDRYVEQKVQRVEILEATLKNQEQRIAQVERFIEKNRGQPKRARQAGSRKKMLEMLEAELVEKPRFQKKIKFNFPQPERSGTPVISLDNIHKRYGNIVVYQGMNFALARGEKVALVGPNGAGKSTLLKICADVLGFDSGQKKLGHNVTTHYFAQHQLDALNPGNSPLEEMSALPGWERIAWLRSLLGALLLGAKEIETKILDLSGGEKAKVALAKMLLNPANLILMDEPTNHLDPQAREVLEDALLDYTGTLLFISHDRTFINNIATRVVEVIDGHLHSFIGNYDDYLRQKEKISKLGTPLKVIAKPAEVKPAPKTETGTAAKINKEDEKERRRREAELRAEKKKLTRDVEKKIADIESKINASEAKLAEMHEEYSRTNLPAERYAELGRDSRAVSEYLKTLYEQWEAASVEMEELETHFRETHGL